MAVVVGWLNSLGTDYLRSGWITTGVTSVRMAVSTSSGMSSPVFSPPATVASSGWVSVRVSGLAANTTYYAQLETDGTLQTGTTLKGQTLGSGALNYVALTGSCQKTGSNHAVFDRMASENAAFLVHQGDIQYQDTNDPTTWRSAFQTSMTATKFAAMLTKFVMHYSYDNHDWAGQGSDASTWGTANPSTFLREVTGEYPATGTTELFRTWVHGRVRWIRTDPWTTRSPQDSTNSGTKRFMSNEQEQWLYNVLSSAQEPLIIFCSAWPLYRSLAGGRWGSYPDQTARIKAWLQARPTILNRMIGIGGDSHAVHADTGANQDALGKMPTLNASPFNQAGPLPSGVWDIGAVDVPDANGVYSRVTITDNGLTLSAKWDAVQDDGTVLLTYTKTVTSGSVGTWNGTSVVPAAVTIADGKGGETAASLIQTY